MHKRKIASLKPLQYKCFAAYKTSNKREIINVTNFLYKQTLFLVHHISGTWSYCLNMRHTRSRCMSISCEEEQHPFSRYPGGSVDLHMDSKTGIAHLVLNQPEKKNALSGAEITMIITIIVVLVLVIVVVVEVVVLNLVTH